MLSGLALIEALDSALPGLPLMLKWPNDVLLGGKKVAGILLERLGDRVVMGFGVNLGSAPELPDRKAAHLSARMTPPAFAPILAATVTRMLLLWRTSEPRAFAKAWLARAHPIGTQLRVHSGDAKRVEGQFEGLGDDGSLRLRLGDGSVRTIQAADVEL